ncbi:MAG: hypothetical protein AAGC77_12800 [Pseudomonadota bacterium]
MVGNFFAFLLRPVRWLARGLSRSSRSAARAGKTSATASAGVAAKISTEDVLEAEYHEEPPVGVETLLFKQLPRPRLTERTAAELTLEQAKTYAAEAQDFYRLRFPLFARGDFFYEDIETDFLRSALGYDNNSIDRRFIDVTTLFRRTLNNNTRSMLLYWTPVLFLVAFGAAYAALHFGVAPPLSDESSIWAPLAIFATAAGVGLSVALLVFSWPYKVVQQRNLLNLDNYVTSKFARINHNFQVAKRRALNVERDKRMGDRDALQEEAGVWTLAYHWFAMRLFACELILRNNFYQVRRNTTLYWAGGLFATLIAALALFAIFRIDQLPPETSGAILGAAAAYLVIAGAIMRRASGMMFRVLQSNEWSRFGQINLDATIRDHVGEDKLQIVTFRDRNRLE